MSYLVLDIETIPDKELWQPPVQESKPMIPKPVLDASWQWTFEKTIIEPEPFPPPYACIPVAIGCLLLSDDLEVQKLGCMGASKYGTDEHGLLADWVSFAARERPTIVDWNGRSFDMPVIALRCFKHKISLEFYDSSYRYRYDEKKHMDLFDLMTEFGAVSKKGFKLDSVARLIGLPGKMGVDGSQVKDMYEEGKFSEIEDYCLTDVIQTAFIFVRYMLWRGRITIPEHDQAVTGLFSVLEKDDRKSVKELLSKTDKTNFLAEVQ